MQSSQTQKRHILVTCALPYANGPVHIGHMVEHLQADFWARFQRMNGHDCRFFCADDTHGTPIMMNARKLGITPEELIAKCQIEHLQDFKDFGIEFTHYSSTHSAANQKFANLFYKRMSEGGYTKVKSIEQLYCNHDKMFLPDRFVKGICPKCKAIDQYGDSCEVCGASYAADDLGSPACAVCGTTPVKKQSEHVFFELDHFRQMLVEWTQKHTAPEVANKLAEWLQHPLRPWDISRDHPYFGFEIPGLKDKYFYVWLDAPIGYVSTTEEWSLANPNHDKTFENYWVDADNTEVYHFIGKDIIYFHCLFWPAMLEAANFRKPNQVFVHGFLTINGEKMSKSRGTFVNARKYLDHIDPMYLRYYLASKMNSDLSDYDISNSDFVNRVNAELIGKITNLGSRAAQMLNKRLGGELCAPDKDGSVLLHEMDEGSVRIANHYEQRNFSKALEEIRNLADRANQYIDGKSPWTVAKTDPEAARPVLSTALNAFRKISVYLRPVLPKYSDQVAALFLEKTYLWNDAAALKIDGKIGEYHHLATRLETDAFDKMIAANTQE